MKNFYETKIKPNAKKIVVVSVMVALLITTGVLNWVLNSSKISGGDIIDGDSVSTFFSAYRENRGSTREEEFVYLDAICESSSASEAAKTAAEQQKLQLVATMECEVVMEGMIKAHGFEDAIVSINNDCVNVVVTCSSQLSDAETAQIVSVVCAQTNFEPTDVKIIPYN